MGGKRSVERGEEGGAGRCEYSEVKLVDRERRKRMNKRREKKEEIEVTK